MENSVRAKSPGDPFDIDGQQFNPDLYLQKLLKERALKEIMDQEQRIVQDTQRLHSEMQTLVYENYNKFISATDTIKKMKSDFKQMETEMDLLATNMNSITSFSDQISNTLHDTRQQISKLSGIHSLLKRLQFVFKLPNKLKALMDEGNYAQAVHDYLHTQQVLNHYAHLESFHGIQNDCVKIVEELKNQLRAQFKCKDASAKELTESVELLLMLGEPADSMYTEVLGHASARLDSRLEALAPQDEDTLLHDTIEFVDSINSGFLSDLCLVVTSYNDLFVNLQDREDSSEVAVKRLNSFVEEKMEKLLLCVEQRLAREQQQRELGVRAVFQDVGITVRALDRLYSRINAFASLFNHIQFSKRCVELILDAGEKECKSQLVSVEAHLEECVRTVRQTVANNSTASGVASPNLLSPTDTDDSRIPQDRSTSSSASTADLLASLLASTVDKMKCALSDLTMFVQPELSFACDKDFMETFSVKCVRQGLIVSFFNRIVDLAASFTGGSGGTVTSSSATSTTSLPSTLLVLAKMCLEFQSTHVTYILNLVEEWFTIPENKLYIKEKQDICERMHSAAQELVNHFVRTEGNTISQMLRKSVETRDWVHSLEPRTVRAVMKRVMEEIASVDAQVGSLFEEGSRGGGTAAERSSCSDSSRRTHLSRSQQLHLSQLHHHKAVAAAATTATNNWSSSSYHIHKLFSERIEIFAPVHFSKVSILTGIIKISLKTLLECIRLRTFSKFGLQQIQVDTHYLQLYLWRYVSDENLVLLMLDEILGSAVHRCMNPALMEPPVVEIICERG